MRTAIYVGVAGFFGSIARYTVSGAVSRVNESFPWGTFAVNITGSFALGFLVAAFADRYVVHPDIRVAVTVGFLGSRRFRQSSTARGLPPTNTGPQRPFLSFL